MNNVYDKIISLQEQLNNEIEIAQKEKEALERKLKNLEEKCSKLNEMYFFIKKWREK